jgi:hypothetical protein
MEITRGEGVHHIVLHGKASDLTKRLFDVVRTGGYFIDLQKIAEMERLQRHLPAQRANIFYHAVDLQQLCVANAALVRQALAEVVGLLENENLSEICPCNTVPFRDVQHAFKSLQRTWKISIKMTPGPEYKPLVKFSTDESYIVAGGVRYVLALVCGF